MKKKLFWLAGLLIVSVAVSTYSYRKGYWIPNYPNESSFPVRGIDVSHHQGAIDWNRVKTGFVYIKATEGRDFKDSKFSENWQGSAKAGIRHGAYHYFTFKAKGREQAKNFLAVVPRENRQLPPVIDLEFIGNNRGDLSIPDFQRELTDFMMEVKRGFLAEPVIYTDPGFLNSYLAGYHLPRIWMRAVIFSPKDDPKWVFWQYSERVKIPGIQGLVDQNVFAGSMDEFNALQ